MFDVKPVQSKYIKRQKRRYVFWAAFFFILSSLIAVSVIKLLSNPMVIESYELYSGKLSNEVEEYRPEVEYWAEAYGISEYVPQLMALMEVESGGEHSDVMQASESLGLPPNSLTPADSINQGTAYFAELLESSQKNGCDINTAIQAYNYGPGFIEYIKERGKTYSFELASNYAAELSDGQQVKYLNLISWRENGGWRYNYGNMFYVRLVNRFIDEDNPYKIEVPDAEQL